jgi:hypothetical protein
VRTKSDREDDAKVRAYEKNEADVVRRALGGPSVADHTLMGPRDFIWERPAESAGADHVLNLIEYWRGPQFDREVIDEEANELISWLLSRRLARLFSAALRLPTGVLCPRTGNGALVTHDAANFARRLNYERA